LIHNIIQQCKKC